VLRWALIFFVLAIVAALLGFGGFVSGTLMEAARWLLIVFVVLIIISAVAGRGPSVPPDPY